MREIEPARVSFQQFIEAPVAAVPAPPTPLSSAPELSPLSTAPVVSGNAVVVPAIQPAPVGGGTTGPVLPVDPDAGAEPSIQPAAGQRPAQPLPERAPIRPQAPIAPQVIETAVFMVARELPATPASAAAANEVL